MLGINQTIHIAVFFAKFVLFLFFVRQVIHSFNAVLCGIAINFCGKEIFS